MLWWYMRERMSAQGLQRIKLLWKYHKLYLQHTLYMCDVWHYDMIFNDFSMHFNCNRQVSFPDLQKPIVSRSPSDVTSLGRGGNVTNVASEAGHVSRDGAPRHGMRRDEPGVSWPRARNFTWFTHCWVTEYQIQMQSSHCLLMKSRLGVQ